MASFRPQLRSALGTRGRPIGTVSGWDVVAVAAALLPAPLVGQEVVVDLPAADSTLNPEVEEVYRIGGLEAERWAAFSLVTSVAFDDAGRLYVFDEDPPRIVVVQRDGSLVREFGREGEGPGEFILPSAFTVLRNGTSVVYDLGRAAFLLFNPDGVFDRQLRFSGRETVSVLGMEPARTRFAVVPVPAVVRTILNQTQRSMTVETGPVEYIVLTGDHPVRQAIVAHRTSGIGAATEAVVFEPGLLIAPLDDGGVAFTDSTTYAINVTDAVGTVVRVLRRPVAPAPVTSALRDAYLESRIELLKEEFGDDELGDLFGGVVDDEFIRGTLADLAFHDEVPVVRALKAGWSSDLLWVERTGTSMTRDGLGGGAVDVLSPEGRYIGTYPAGTLPLPDAFGPDGLAAFIEYDQAGILTIVVRKLTAVR